MQVIQKPWHWSPLYYTVTNQPSCNMPRATCIPRTLSMYLHVLALPSAIQCIYLCLLCFSCYSGHGSRSIACTLTIPLILAQQLCARAS